MRSQRPYVCIMKRRSFLTTALSAALVVPLTGLAQTVPERATMSVREAHERTRAKDVILEIGRAHV